MRKYVKERMRIRTYYKHEYFFARNQGDADKGKKNTQNSYIKRISSAFFVVWSNIVMEENRKF